MKHLLQMVLLCFLHLFLNNLYLVLNLLFHSYCYRNEYSKLKEADAVILIEKLGETRFDKLGEMVSLCEEGSRPVAGVIVIE